MRAVVPWMEIDLGWSTHAFSSGSLNNQSHTASKQVANVYVATSGYRKTKAN